MEDLSEEDNLYDRMKCCDDREYETVEQKNYSKNRFTEEYTCKNCKKTIVYYIRMLRYERYSPTGEVEDEIPLADESLIHGKSILHLVTDAFVSYVDAEDTEDFADVIRQLDEIICESDSYQAYQLKARILNRLERHEEALQVWNKSIDLEKMSGSNEGEYSSEINRIGTYSRLGDDKQALALCEKFLENHPDDLLALENKVIFTFNLKNYKKVIEMCGELEKRFPTILHKNLMQAPKFYYKQRISETVSNIYATSLFFEKRFEESESIVKGRLESEDLQSKTEFLGMMSDLLLIRGKPQDALDNINKASKIDPTDDDVWMKKAEILLALDNIEETLDCLLIATSLNPEIKSSIRDNEAFLPLSENDRYRKIIN